MILNTKEYTKFKAGTVIRQKLLNDPSVRGIVNERIWPLERLEGSEEGPFILYELTDYTVDETKQGPFRESISMYIGCIASDYDVTVDLAEAVFNCLYSFYNYKDEKNKIIINKISIIDLKQSFLDDKYCSTLKFKIE